MPLRTSFARALEDWRRYRRTVAEIEAMPLDVALDLDICREDARKIAARAVYGRRAAEPARSGDGPAPTPGG
jgi:uncharacterized protein YjiS (DUF1127 family)